MKCLPRIVLDINILFKLFITREPDTEAYESYKVFNCILYKWDEMKVICTPEVTKCYENLFSRIANGYFHYKSSFILPLEQNRQIEYVNPMTAPCTINDPDDQIYLDCAHGGNADIIISNDSDFKLFELGDCKFQCFTTSEFLSKICSEYI